MFHLFRAVLISFIAPSLLFSFQEKLNNATLLADFRLATLPKCGTHLLVKCLHSLGAMPEISESKFGGITLSQELQNQYGWHLKDSVVDNIFQGSHKYLIMIRDIRDAILSLHEWMPYFYIKYDQPDLYDQAIHSFGGDSDLQLLNLISENPEALGSWYLKRSRLAVSLYQQQDILPHVLFVKYEDLIGPNGGGSLHRQIQTVQKIAQFLNIPNVDENKASLIAAGLWGNTETFNTSTRKGQINAWKKHYNAEHIRAFKQHWNGYLISFGYETTEDWDLQLP